MIRRILKEPLVHFMVLAVLIFVVFFASNDVPERSADIGDQIILDEADVERLIDRFAQVWRRPPTRDELQGLIDSEIQNEVLVREAENLGLDQNDSVIRSRLVQKMDFLTTSVAQSMEPEEDVLAAHFAANPERFAAPGKLSFEQVFLGQQVSDAQMAAALDALQSGAAPEEMGVRSLLPPQMDLTGEQSIDGSFGQGFYAQLEVLNPGEWAGPARSGYGLHLVRVTEKQAGRMPALDEVREAVLLDWRRDTADELAQLQIDALKERYDITLPDLTGFDAVLSQ